MGRVLLYERRGQITSLKCRSKERAEEIARKRPNVVRYEYYDDRDVIPRAHKARKEHTSIPTMEELERMIKQRRL